MFKMLQIFVAELITHQLQNKHTHSLLLHHKSLWLNKQKTDLPMDYLQWMVHAADKDITITHK